MLQQLLIIEDNPADAVMLQEHIEAGFDGLHISVASSLQQALDVLQRQPIDFIVLDLTLPDSSGIETLQSVAQAAGAQPILVYSGNDNAALALQAVKMGAQDYLVKGRGNAATIKRIIEHSVERKQIEMQLSSNEQMLRAFIRHSPAGIAVFDNDYRMVMASERWRAGHGLEQVAIEGKQFNQLCPKAGRKWHELYLQALGGEHIQCPEDEFTTNDGRTEYIRWEMMPWFDAEGKVGGVIEFVEFITQQRAMRRELEDAKNTLEAKVEERTQELRAAMETALQAQYAKDEFFTNMTHELRTPLHAIINFSQFGSSKAGQVDNEQIISYFRDILTSGQRLLGLVNDLLDLSKHKIGMANMELQPVALSELFADVQQELSSLIESRQMRVQCLISEACDWVMCDRKRIYQVMINLLSNAMKFSDAGTAIAIASEPAWNYERLRGLATPSLVISVSDQGSGIPPDELVTVFNEFTQSSKVKSGAFAAGTGLGLAICRQIVQAHGGIIWAENNPDRGAVVRFVLPLAME